MAVGKCFKSESILDCVQLDNICVGGGAFRRVIPVAKWHIWCYERWRFAPGLQHESVDNEPLGHFYLSYGSCY